MKLRAYNRHSKFVIPDLELVTVYENEGDLMSITQENSSAKVNLEKKIFISSKSLFFFITKIFQTSYRAELVVSPLPSNSLSPKSAAYGHDKVRFL